jgi:O-succinylbenzoate synthase
MLETGVGRAANVALASLPHFTLPNDISGSDRYYRDEVIDPPFRVDADGTIAVPTGPGLGVTVLHDEIERRAIRRESVGG